MFNNKFDGAVLTPLFQARYDSVTSWFHESTSLFPNAEEIISAKGFGKSEKEFFTILHKHLIDSNVKVSHFYSGKSSKKNIKNMHNKPVYTQHKSFATDTKFKFIMQTDWTPIERQQKGSFSYLGSKGRYYNIKETMNAAVCLNWPKWPEKTYT